VVVTHLALCHSVPDDVVVIDSLNLTPVAGLQTELSNETLSATVETAFVCVALCEGAGKTEGGVLSVEETSGVKGNPYDVAGRVS